MTVKTYKPCEEKCGKCKQCVEFKKVVAQIDLTKQSKHRVAIENRLKDFER
jgi:hypothetical protein